MAKNVNLQKSFSAANEALTKVFDESGVRRAFTVPYVDGQSAADHVTTVGQVAAQAGGLGNNLLTTSHHSTGKGYGTGDGHTVGHPAESLRNTVIPKDDEHAKAAIDAVQTHLNNIGKLIGDDTPEVKTANNQLALVKKTDGAGMNLMDFGIFLTQLMNKPNQAIARAHHAANGGVPGAGGAEPETPEGDAGAPAGGEEQEAPAAGDQTAGGEASAAPEAQEAPAAAPAAPQAQG